MPKWRGILNSTIAIWNYIKLTDLIPTGEVLFQANRDICVKTIAAAYADEEISKDKAPSSFVYKKYTKVTRGLFGLVV